MKKLLILLFLSLGFIGSASAGEVKTNILKLKALNACESCNLQGAIGPCFNSPAGYDSA